jgi:hypothetical protein
MWSVPPKVADRPPTQMQARKISIFIGIRADFQRHLPPCRRIDVSDRMAKVAVRRVRRGPMRWHGT